MNKLTLTSLVLCIFLVATHRPFQMAIGAERDKPEHRTLHFPDEAIGRLFLLAPQQWTDDRTDAVAVAKGTVSVDIPTGFLLELSLGTKALQNPKLLAQLSAEPIDCMKILFYSMDESDVSSVDKAMVYVGKIHNLQTISLDRSDASDASLESLQSMPKLTKLTCLHTQITGSAFKHVAAVAPNISALRIWYCPIKQSAWKELASFHKLEQLNGSSTRLSDENLSHIAKCTELVTLRIFENPISDKGLSALKNLRHLRWLDITKTNTTMSGIRSLKGISLQRIDCPKSVGVDNDPELRRLFPGSQIFHQKPSSVSASDLQMFAPQH